MSSKNYCAHREPLSSGFCPDCECDVSIWKTMSDTPRTEASLVSREFIAREMDIYKHKFVLSSVAEQLELELSAKTAECAELRSQLDAVLKRTSLSFKYPGGEKP